MRISLTGAAGIGKTTLARALAEELDVPLLPEDFAPIVQAFNHGPLLDAQVRAACRQACERWLQQRAARYLGQAGFIEDRCALDVLFRWLLAGLSDRDNTGTRALVAQVRAMLDATGYLVILPLIETEETRNHDGLRRAGSSSRLILAQAMTLGLAVQYLPSERLILVPVDCDGVPARVKFVRACIEQRVQRSA